MPHGRPAKRRKLTPPVDDDNATSRTVKASELFRGAADWDLEQDYEHRSRHKKVKESTKLPIKNTEGRVEQVAPTQGAETDDGQDDDENEISSDSDLQGEHKAEGHDKTLVDQVEVPAIPLKLQILQVQEDVARLAGLIAEDPEEHAGSFKKLAQLADSKSHPSLQKIVLLSQAAIYKDAVPGYRIRAYKDEDLSTKISKEVRKTRQYEQALVTNYQAYIRHLESLTNRQHNDESSLRMTALNCACSLLLAVPHFNCRTDLLGILVRELSSKQGGLAFQKSIDTLEQYFREDEDGSPSLEAVNLISKMIKARDYDVREEVLNVFFHLRLLTELSAKSSTTRTDRPEDVSKLHGRRAKKEKLEHRSKKERKVAKERRAVEKDMQEANAAVDFEAREKTQSETLKLVFVIYFRILKERIPHLMGAVLEGLAKFAHLINQDFFGDILEALKDIVSQAQADYDEEDTSDEVDRDHVRETLLATQTAFTLLSQQDAAKAASSLHLDLSFFTQHIYKSLYAITVDSDVEFGPKSLHLPDPHGGQHNKRDNKVNVFTPVLLLTRALTAILLTPSQPPTTQVVTAFYKRLLTCALQTPEKSTQALLALMDRLVQKYGRRLEPLWYSDERKGDGVFRGEAETVEGTNVLAMGSGVWEAELLRHHYCPEVREQVKSIDKVIAGLSKGT